MDETFFQVRHYGWKYEKVCMSLGISPVTSLGVAFRMEKILVRHYHGSKVYNIKAFRIISLIFFIVDKMKVKK